MRLDAWCVKYLQVFFNIINQSALLVILFNIRKLKFQRISAFHNFDK